MNIPISQQAPAYREQVIPSDANVHPEILVSFGKYDNQGDRIEYVSLQNQMVKNLSSLPTISPTPLPVTLTVDRYTIRAKKVFWYKRNMRFLALGDVSVSDGHATVRTASAVLSFPHGMPTVDADATKKLR